jgi:hypothetical protein
MPDAFGHADPCGGIGGMPCVGGHADPCGGGCMSGVGGHADPGGIGGMPYVGGHSDWEDPGGGGGMPGVGSEEVEPLQEDEADIVGSAEAPSCMVEIHDVRKYRFGTYMYICVRQT